MPKLFNNMVTSKDCIKKYGLPELQKNLKLFDVPAKLEIGVIPKRIYCNIDIIEPLTKAFEALINTEAVKELVTWDGCFNIRKKRINDTYSLHSWGVAIDINAFENQMGTSGKLSQKFVKCFIDNGFDWGGNWTLKDPMHFQLTKI